MAVGVSRLGLESAWVSKLPENPLGRMVGNKAREHGVDTSNILCGASPGDLNWATLEEVEAQVKGAGSRIQR